MFTSAGWKCTFARARKHASVRRHTGTREERNTHTAGCCITSSVLAALLPPQQTFINKTTHYSLAMHAPEDNIAYCTVTWQLVCFSFFFFLWQFPGNKFDDFSKSVNTATKQHYTVSLFKQNNLYCLDFYLKFYK